MKKLADKKSLSNVLLNCEFNYFSLSRPTYSRILFLIMFGLFGLIQMGYGNLGLHSLIIKTDGSLWTFGRNTYGQLGDGSSTHRRTPTQILSSGVARVSSGNTIRLLSRQMEAYGLLGEMLKANLVMEPRYNEILQLRFCLRVFLRYLLVILTL